MGRPFVAACVQLTAARDIALNLPELASRIRAARAAGADLILLPENAAMLEPVPALVRQKAQPESDHPALAALRELARETGAWILIGSLAVRLQGGNDGGTVANRCLLVDAAGEVVARYDKIHLFDVDLNAAEVYRESATIAAGDRAVIADTPWARLGLSVCYDLRFPGLYRALAQAGADVLVVPAAFTRTTGRAHWHVLLRARAIETGCYVLAPAQCGIHAEGRETYGHSLIVDPWGTVLADGGEAPGIIAAGIDPEAVADARRRIPSLTHDRPFLPPGPRESPAGA
ncbi:MAG: carbon-nitrogen hydrolase family protein [Rhodospirillales bacterium]|nr:MAG: carbon-nitrogen hydrolase family protein [Rhodospirillales bacterium]